MSSKAPWADRIPIKAQKVEEEEVEPENSGRRKNLGYCSIA